MARTSACYALVTRTSLLVCANSDLSSLSTVGDNDVGQLGTKMAPEAI